MIVPNVATRTSETPVPVGYRLENVILTNHAGRELDIKRLVVDFQIAESIYTPYLTLTLSIRDSVNLLEEMAMSGQETLTISIARSRLGGEPELVKLEFWVTEYPVYGRFGNRLQAYTIRGVSRHAFLNQLKKVSRAVSGPGNLLVQGILTGDLGIDPSSVVSSDGSVSAMSVVIPYMRPLDAVAWILRRSHDEDGSGLHCWQTLDGNMRIQSLGSMMVQDPYRTYRDASLFSTEVETQADFDNRISRIASMSSDLRLSKIAGAASGAFAASSLYVDPFSKTMGLNRFSAIDQPLSSLEAELPFSSNFAPESGRTLADYPEAMRACFQVDSGNDLSYSSTALESAAVKIAAYEENLDSMICDLELSGDPGLRAGLVADLQIPKASDPQSKTVNSTVIDPAGPDLMFSGKYLVTAVVHRFSGEYTCSARVKRNSFPSGFFNR